MFDKNDNVVPVLEERELHNFWTYISREDVVGDLSLQKAVLDLFNRRNNEANEYVSEKRTIFQSWYKKYRNPSEFKDALIKVHTVHQQMKTFVAMFQSTNLTVNFGWQEMGDDETARRVMKMANYDRWPMRKEMKDVRALRNLWFYGAAVRVKTQWNREKKVIDYMNINPRNRKPDKNGDVIEDNFEYHFFDVKQTWYEFLTANSTALAWDIFFNLDDIQMSWDMEDNATWQANFDKNVGWLWSLDWRRGIYDFVSWSMKINWRWYSIGVANGGWLLIKFEPFLALTKEEKSNPLLIPDQVNVWNIFPMEGDPMGIGYGELIMDKQNAINRLSNMALIKEQREAWFDTYLVDTNIVSNIHALKKRPINWPIFIPWRRKDW